MNFKAGFAAILALGAMSVFASEVPKGTAVMLQFDQSISSKTAHVGDRVKMHVSEDVMINGKTVIKQGTAVTGVLSDVQKRGRFGKNAQMKLSINPVMVHGVAVSLQPRQKGNMIGGTRGTTAAAASGAGALVLGPVGLAAGYFVVGKAVTIKVGDTLETQVSKDVNVK